MRQAINQLITFLKSSRIVGSSWGSTALVTKGCFRTFFISSLSEGCFLMVLRMKSWASGDTSTHAGKVISSLSWVKIEVYDAAEVGLRVNPEGDLA